MRTDPRPLKSLNREDLEPLWSRRDIPLERIASALGVSRQSVSSKAKSLGLPSRQGNRKPAARLDDTVFERMWLAGVNSREMAAYFGYADASSVSHRRINMGLPPRNRGAGGVTSVRYGWAETISLAQFRELQFANACQRVDGETKQSKLRRQGL
jgi:hypothetical protein